MRLTIPYRDYTKPGMVDNMRLATLSAAMAKLQKYEDAEEQGRLIVLPCKVGTTVWFIKTSGFHPEIIETCIDEIGVRHSGGFIKLACNSQYRTAISAWGKTVFTSRADAEAALKGETE